MGVQGFIVFREGQLIKIFHHRPFSPVDALPVFVDEEDSGISPRLFFSFNASSTPPWQFTFATHDGGAF
jgi:hypothetical protein